MFRAFSKIFQAGKLTRLGVKDVLTSSKRTSATHGKWYYRTSKPYSDASTLSKVGAELLGGFMWYYILWHFYYDFSRLTGHYDRPDPLVWTDEELGIPPEDE